MEFTRKPTLLEIYDVGNNLQCIISNDSEYDRPFYDGTIDIVLNDTNKLIFKINADSDKVQYLKPDNMIFIRKDNKIDIEDYIISKVTLVDDDLGYYEIECESYYSILKNKVCESIDVISETCETLITRILKDTGIVFGGTDMPTTKRHLKTESESAFTNLIMIAENFGNARIEFKTQEIGGVIKRSVYLYDGNTPIKRGKYIEKGRDMDSVTMSYSIENMVTKLIVYGDKDKVTNMPINMIDAHPQKKYYVENYDYYLNQGLTLGQISNNPRYVKEMIIEDNKLRNPQQVYDYAIQKIKEVSIPLVECSATIKDLSLIEEYMMEEPIIGENIDLYNFDINFQGEAMIIGISKNLDNPLESVLTLSNIVIINTTLKDLVQSSDIITNITDSDGKLNGNFIADMTIGTAQIGHAVIDSANIKELAVKHANIDFAEIGQANIDIAYIGSANIKEANIETAHIKDLNVTSAKIDFAEIAQANIDIAYINHANIDFADIAEANIDVAYIKKANIASEAVGDSQISDLSAVKITAGTIDLAKANIRGSNNTIQIEDGQLLINDTSDLLHPFNRVLLGRYMVDVQGEQVENYGLIVRSKDGNTVMIDGDGVHNAGITSGAIDDNKISDDANISGSKLDIGSVITTINNHTGEEHIQSGSIYFDNESLDVRFQHLILFENETNETLTSHESGIKTNADEIKLRVTTNVYENDKLNNDKRFEANETAINLNKQEIELKVSQTEMKETITTEIDNNLAYKMETSSTNGNIFKNGNIDTTLSVRIYKGKVDVTDVIPNSAISWVRTSLNIEMDEVWNAQHVGYGKVLKITRDDVDNEATFGTILDM